MQDIKEQHKVIEFLIINFEALFNPKTELKHSISEQEMESLNESIMQELLEVSREEGRNEKEEEVEENFLEDLETNFRQETPIQIEVSSKDKVICNEGWTLKILNNSLFLNSKYNYYYSEIESDLLACSLVPVSSTLIVVGAWKDKIGIFVPPISWTFIECEAECFQDCLNQSQCFLIGTPSSIPKGSFTLFLRDSLNKKITAFFGKNLGEYQRALLETIGEVKKYSISPLSMFYSDRKINVSVSYKKNSFWKERLFEISLNDKKYNFGPQIDLISKKVINSKEWILRKTQQHLYLNSQYYTVLEDNFLCSTLLSTDDIPVILSAWENRFGFFVPPLSWYYIKTDSKPFQESIERGKSFLFGNELSIRKGVFALFIKNSSNNKLYSFLSRSSTEVTRIAFNFFFSFFNKINTNSAQKLVLKRLAKLKISGSE